MAEVCPMTKTFAWFTYTKSFSKYALNICANYHWGNRFIEAVSLVLNECSAFSL